MGTTNQDRPQELCTSHQFWFQTSERKNSPLSHLSLGDLQHHVQAVQDVEGWPRRLLFLRWSFGRGRDDRGGLVGPGIIAPDQRVLRGVHHLGDGAVRGGTSVNQRNRIFEALDASVEHLQ